MSNLSITNVITVSLANSQAGLNPYNTGNLVLFSHEVPGPSFGVGPYQAYTGPTSVESDWGSGSETSAMANAIFSQQPNILLPSGQLYVVPYLAAQQNLALSGIPASGSFEITSANGSTAAIAWNATTAQIQTALQAVGGQSSWTVSGSLAGENLIVTMGGSYGPQGLLTISANSLMTAAPAAITFVISSLVAGEQLAAIIARSQPLIQYFGAISTVIYDQADVLAAAAVAQPLGFLLGVVSNNLADLTAVSGTYAKIVAGGFSKTRCLYYGANVASLVLSGTPASGSFVIAYGPQLTVPIAWNASVAAIQSALQGLVGLGSVVVSGSLASGTLMIQMLGVQGAAQISIPVATSLLLNASAQAISIAVSYQQSDPLVFLAAYFGSGMSVDFQGSNTTITQNLKSFVGVLPDLTLTQTIQNLCTADGADTYPSIQGDPACLSSGANLFFDQAQNRLWFVNAIAIASFNYLAQTGTKIPQTEDGMSGFKSAQRQICKLGVNNQYLAPGTWTNPTTFGNQALLYANIAQKGYYIYSSPIASQSAVVRASRAAPLVQIAIQEAGAIQSASILIYVNP
jgi:hypothetical protein